MIKIIQSSILTKSARDKIIIVPTVLMIDKGILHACLLPHFYTLIKQEVME